ncbi:MAG: hypothetical protein IJ830_07270 [Alphaproteobacteria bacterium]|nr:hypothetical protein [Alphaproteobacteria bacterium]
MKLYHYAPKENTLLKDGLLSISKVQNSYSLKAYAHRAGSENRSDIIAWLEKTFPGRSRSISCLTEPIKWQNNDEVLKKIVDGTVLFSFELDDLIKDHLVESIWCKNGSDANGYNEQFYQITPEQIDLSPLAWEKVNSSKGFLYAVIRHYLIVLKDGYIPPRYLHCL